VQAATCVAGRRPPGAGGGAGRKAGTWGAVQKTLQVITGRTLDAASSRLSSMALGAASLKDSFLVDKARASTAPRLNRARSRPSAQRHALHLPAAGSLGCLRLPGWRAYHARFQPIFASEQGKDAWIAVGGAAVEVATSLDSAVEHLLEGWASPQPGAPRGAARAAGSPHGSAPERCLVSICVTPSPPVRPTSIHPSLLSTQQTFTCRPGARSIRASMFCPLATKSAAPLMTQSP